MGKKSLFLIIGLLFTKVFGIFRELALGNLYGPGAISDAYLIASNIPNVIYGFVASGLITTFIPIYSKVINKDGEKEANKFMSNVINLMVTLALVLAIFGFIFADGLVSIFADFGPETQVMAVQFVRISMFSIVFITIKSLLEGYLQVRQQFNVSPISGLIMNVVVISSIVISYLLKQPIIMAFGVILSIIAQAVFAIYMTKKQPYKHLKVYDIKDENIGSMIQMAAPIILGSSVDQINKVIDTKVASSIAVGGVSTLNFAVKISDSILSIFVGAISTVMYPSLSAQAAAGDISKLKVTVNKVMTTINLLIFPATVGLIVLAFPVVEILYGRKFSPAELDLTTQTLIWYTVGTVAYGMRIVLTRTFYALRDSVTPVISSVISVAINIVLNLTLSQIMGLPGLPLATSLAALFSVFFLYNALLKKIGSLNTKQFIVTSLKILVASVIMGIGVYAVYAILGGRIGFMISIIVGVIIYAIVIYLMKIEESDQIFEMILSKLKGSH